MGTPKLIWELATGYDLFVSLEVLHKPSRYGLRGSWAAGVRSRLPAGVRDILQIAMQHKVWGVPWLTTVSGPKDGAAVLNHLADIPARERLAELTRCYLTGKPQEILHAIKERGHWNPEDKERIQAAYQLEYHKAGKKTRLDEEELNGELNIWAEAEVFGEELLQALEVYYEVFFAEEEDRIRPALEATNIRAQDLAQRLTLIELLEELSQGLRFDLYEGLEGVEEITFVPSFWTTPLTLFTPIANESHWLFMFGGRPADVSLVPGETVPELLYQMLKALADPSRLRIMRYLSAEPSTPAELARRLRLRAPTVLHHLDALRLARLVQVTLSYEGRRYEARREAVQMACQMLREFLED